MRKIFIDLEAIKAGQIISIGAIDEQGSTYYTLVKPVNLKGLTPFLSKLTGITKEMLMEDAVPSFESAFDKLGEWIGQEEAIFLTYGSNDRELLSLYEHLTCKRIMATLIDYSTSIIKKFGSSIGLERIAKSIYGIEFTQTHNALDDAKLLMDIYNFFQRSDGKELIIPKRTVRSNDPRDYSSINLALKITNRSGKFYQNFETAVDGLWTKACHTSKVKRKHIRQALFDSLTTGTKCNHQVWYYES